MTLLDRLKKYIKHNFSLQEFTDYKTADNQIVTGDLVVGKQLLDVESMTPVDGEVVIDGKKVVVEKGIVKSVEDMPSEPIDMEVPMDMTETSVEVEVCDECGEEDCSCGEGEMPMMEGEMPEAPEAETPEMAAQEDTHMQDMMDTLDMLKSEIESLKGELETLKNDKTQLTSKIEELSNKPVQEVFKSVEPIKSKTNSRESLLNSLKEIKSSIE